MTRPMRNPGPQMVKLRNEISVPIDSQLYAFCSRMKQTPIRSMLMAHGCCFDFFEKGICKAGNDCKYSHLKPGDERNLVMDSEAGLRRKKYYRPETLETYRPGSQDVICFTYARKGWCIHGDRCWNQHISPPGELLADISPGTFNGLPLSDTPSPDQDDMPILLDTGFTSGYGLTQPLAQYHTLGQTPSPVAMTNPHWSAATITHHSGQQHGNYNKQKQPNEHIFAAKAHTQGKGTYFCHPDPKRTAAPNWRIPNTPAAIMESTPSPIQAAPVFKPTPVFKPVPVPVTKAAPAPIAKPATAPAVRTSPIQLVKTAPVTVQPQPIRSALNEFNWRPVIQDQETNWRKASAGKKPATMVGNTRPALPTLQIPTRAGAVPRSVRNTATTPVDYNHNLIDLDEVDQQKPV
ncbi:hypothetical protein TWF281_007708 [Arthrobotrys megalospora]